MANITIDYGNSGMFAKSVDQWVLSPGETIRATGPKPESGDIITLTNYKCASSYTPGDATAIFYYDCTDGENTVYGQMDYRTPVSGIDEAVTSGTISFKVLSVTQGDGTWDTEVEFLSEPEPTTEKALGGNAVAFFKEKIEANAPLLLYVKSSDIVDGRTMSFYTDGTFTTTVTVGTVHAAVSSGRDVKILRVPVDSVDYSECYTYSPYRVYYPKVCNDGTMDEIGMVLDTIEDYGTYSKQCIRYQSSSGPSYTDFNVDIESF